MYFLAFFPNFIAFLTQYNKKKFREMKMGIYKRKEKKKQKMLIYCVWIIVYTIVRYLS